jgi:hypothetical protein
MTIRGTYTHSAQLFPPESSLNPMDHTVETKFIENIARAQIKYEATFSAQAEILRTDPPNFNAAMAKIQALPLVAKPAQGDVDLYLTRCDEMCAVTPKCFDE